MTLSDLDDENAFDPTSRRLCPDGACIGVLDENGRCKVCGVDAPESAFGAVVTTDDPAPADDVLESLGSDEPGGFDVGRRLCPDGTCIGVLGEDGLCKVCGCREER